MVIAIIGIFGALSIPSISESQKRNQINEIVNEIESQTQLALLEAKTFNHPIILIWWGDHDQWPQGLQRGKIENQKWIPLGKAWVFPPGIDFYREEGYSTLIEALQTQDLKQTLTNFEKPVFKIMEVYPSGRLKFLNSKINRNQELTLTLGLRSDLIKKETKKMIFYSIHVETGKFVLMGDKN